MSRFQDVVTDNEGNGLPGAIVTVRDYPTGNLSTLTADSGGSLTNPIVADANGAYYFNAANAIYSLEFRLLAYEPAREVRLVNLGNLVDSVTLAATTGAALIGANDASSGSLFTTVAGFIAKLLSSAGSSVIGFIQSGTGAVPRSVQDKLRESVTAADFGAVGDGTTNDSAAILLAITAAGPGGSVTLAAGKTYAIASTLVLSTTGARLICVAGEGDTHDTGAAFTAPATLKWVGTSGGTMVQVKSASTQFISGNEFRGIFLDGNSGLAAVGLNLVGCRLGTFEVVGQHCTSALLKMDPDTALSEPQGCSENRIKRVSGYQTNVGDGAHVLQTCTASWNCSQNVFELISGDFRNSYAIDIQGSDAETFQVVKLFASLASAVGVRFKGGATVGQAARNNMFHYLAVTGATVPVLASGTSFDTSPSVENNILFLDTANNPNLPTIDTAASLWWGTIRSPLGLRSYTPTIGGSSVYQQASGLIIQSGVTGSIAAGGNSVVTLPKAFTTGVTSVQVTPKNAGMAAFADCSSTQITVNNTGASPAVFWWRVEGV